MILDMPLEILLKDNTKIKKFKTQLEQTNNFVRPIYRESEYTVIRTNLNSNELDYIQNLFPNEIVREYKNDIKNEKTLIDKHTDTVHDILGFTRIYFQDKIHPERLREILEHVPLKYSIYPPVLLLNNSNKRSFDHEVWSGLLTEDYCNKLLKFLSASKCKTTATTTTMTETLRVIAINRPIIEHDNIVRRPYNIELLYSMDHPLNPDLLSKETLWCEVKQNGIWQIWNPFHTMFSRGNIKEKKRIIDSFIDIENNDVIDLYCGIGYFSFSYLSRNCRNLFGFELNPWSVEGFNKGLQKNKNFGRSLDGGGGVKAEGIYIYNENNEMSDQRLTEFKLKYRQKQNNSNGLRIRHINMGLLPSSRQGYPVALKLITNHNNWEECPKVTLHIHENASIKEISQSYIQEKVLNELSFLNDTKISDIKYQFELIHLEKIKTFAPNIWHICLDIDVIKLQEDI